MALRIESAGVWSRLQSGLAQLTPVTSRVLNRAAVTLKRRWPAQGKRDITQQFALKPSKISSSLHADIISGSSVSLTAYGRPQPLSFFPARQNARGVAVTIEKGSTLQIDHAFLQIPRGAPQAGFQVFIRIAALGSVPEGVEVVTVNGQRTKHGYPVAILRGPTVAKMLATGNREDRLFDFAGTVLFNEIERLNLAEVLRGK